MFPSAFTGRAVPSGRCQLHGPSRSDVSPAWAPTLRPVRPCGFSLPRVSIPFFACVETPPARVIRKAMSFAYVPGPRPGLLSRPGRASYRPATLLGFVVPFAVLIRPEGGHASSARPGPPAVSPFTRREFHRRGASSAKTGNRVSRPRLLGFASLPQVSRAVSSADPAMAFMHRVVRTHRPGLPWDSRSSLRSSASRLRPPLLKTVPPGLLEPPPATSLQR